MRGLLLFAAAAAAVGITAVILAQGKNDRPAAPAPVVEQTAKEAPGRVPVPEPSEKALRYYRSGNILWVVSSLWGFLVPLAFLFTGFSARLRILAQRLGRKWFFVVAIYGILMTLIGFVIDLPLTYYLSFVREHQYGLSDQTVAKWWSDSFKGLAVSLILTALTLWVPYLLLRKSPKRWWLYTGLASVPLIVLLLMITPVWIEPLFNKFGPMKDKALEQKILALADRAGITGGRVYEVEKSVDTKTVNAYVNGLGKTKRIVLWDTLVKKLNPDQTLFVMGHEMGHYVLGHVRGMVALLCGLVFLGLYVIHRTAAFVIVRHRERFGFTELSDVASLPLVSLLFGVTLFVLTPLVFVVTRHNEHEADRFGLEITRNNHAAASSFVQLQEENLAIPRPGPLFKIWRSSHPPIGERIDFANDYHPWTEGKPLKYGGLFRGGAEK